MWTQPYYCTFSCMRCSMLIPREPRSNSQHTESSFKIGWVFGRRGFRRNDSTGWINSVSLERNLIFRHWMAKMYILPRRLSLSLRLVASNFRPCMWAVFSLSPPSRGSNLSIISTYKWIFSEFTSRDRYSDIAYVLWGTTSTVTRATYEYHVFELITGLW